MIKRIHQRKWRKTFGKTGSIEFIQEGKGSKDEQINDVHKDDIEAKTIGNNKVIEYAVSLSYRNLSLRINDWGTVDTELHSYSQKKKLWLLGAGRIKTAISLMYILKSDFNLSYCFTKCMD